MGSQSHEDQAAAVVDGRVLRAVKILRILKVARLLKLVKFYRRASPRLAHWGGGSRPYWERPVKFYSRAEPSRRAPAAPLDGRTGSAPRGSVAPPRLLEGGEAMATVQSASVAGIATEVGLRPRRCDCWRL